MPFAFYSSFFLINIFRLIIKIIYIRSGLRTLKNSELVLSSPELVKPLLKKNNHIINESKTEEIKLLRCALKRQKYLKNNFQF